MKLPVHFVTTTGARSRAREARAGGRARAGVRTKVRARPRAGAKARVRARAGVRATAMAGVRARTGLVQGILQTNTIGALQSKQVLRGCITLTLEYRFLSHWDETNVQASLPLILYKAANVKIYDMG